MWILPSRLRPHNIARLVQAAAVTDMTTPVWLRLDYNDPRLEEYLELDLPDNWSICVSTRLPLGEIIRCYYVANSGLSWYGFLADDVVPETLQWDTELVKTAGNNSLAYADDGKHGRKFASHFVLGGDLVREIGWLALEGLHRIYIDTVWNDIAKAKGVLRYREDVRLIHYHFSNRLAQRDATYIKPHNNDDRLTYIKWRRAGGPSIEVD